MQNQKDMSLGLSTIAKPRLKWTSELHQRFVESVTQLGGLDKATPKSLMRVMGIPGLSLHHLKSHLQKYRLGKSQQSETCIDNMQSDYRDNQNRDKHRELDDLSPNQISENLQIAQALQMQMEVQRKLHEQIEIQRHLQLRIEAQEKYLHTVLKKAQETLVGCKTSPEELVLARDELSQLVSMISAGCRSSPISDLTEAGGSSLKHIELKHKGNTLRSMESSLSSESSGSEEEKLPKDKIGKTPKSSSTIELHLMNMRREDESYNPISYQSKRQKRSTGPSSYGDCVDRSSDSGSPSHKDRSMKMTKHETTIMLDLNSHYQEDIKRGSESIDLNK